jgi:hypothetical protein
VLTREQKSNFIKRVLEIEQELNLYPEKKKDLDNELILLARNYNNSHKISSEKKVYKCVQVEEISDMIQVRFSFVEREN